MSDPALSRIAEQLRRIAEALEAANRIALAQAEALAEIAGEDEDEDIEILHRQIGA